MNNKVVLFAILIAASFILQGCFLFEQRHDFGFENILENKSVTSQFTEPIAKVEDVKCVNFDVKTPYEKVSDNWYKVSIIKKLELNGKDISNDYLKLLDTKHPTPIENFFLNLVKDEQNLFKPDIIYVNPSDLSAYLDKDGKTRVEDAIKSAQFNKEGWSEIFSKILGCYNFQAIPKYVCENMSIGQLHDYIELHSIKNEQCLIRLEQDGFIKDKLNQWNLNTQFQDSKNALELKRKFLDPFRDKCFKDSACELGERCEGFSCIRFECPKDYSIYEHKCVYYPFSKAKKAKYIYLYVPLGNWSEREWEDYTLASADIFTSFYPIKDCKINVSILNVPLEYANKKCQIATMGLQDGTRCPNVYDIYSCGQNYAQSNSIANVERVIGFSHDPLCQGGGIKGYTFFYFKGAYAQLEFYPEAMKRFEQPAHELSHTYLLCDEYSYDFWDLQNRQVTCANKWPESCDKKSDCVGNKADVFYNGKFPDSSPDCTGPDRYSIMGSVSSGKQCGLEQSAYDSIAKSINCD